jgi:hypothetical protein
VESLSRLILLALVGAFFVNLTRGTATAWLRAKFLGDGNTGGSTASSPRLPASSPLARTSSPGGRGGV